MVVSGVTLTSGVLPAGGWTGNQSTYYKLYTSESNKLVRWMKIRVFVIHFRVLILNHSCSFISNCYSSEMSQNSNVLNYKASLHPNVILSVSNGALKLIEYIDLGKPKSEASVIYLDVVNNYTIIQHVKQILVDFVVSAVSSQNCAGKCAKSQVLFLPTASQSFVRP